MVKIYTNKEGSKYYYIPSEREMFWGGDTRIKGILHRENGPAIEYTNGFKAWYINDKRHREDGFAVEWGGYKAWYINDKKLSYEEWFEYIMTHSSKEIQINVLINPNFF